MNDYSTQDTEISIQENPDMAIVYQQDKAAIDTQIATAKRFPRDLKRALDNAIFTVTLDKETASTCTYSLPRGGKSINGPSVHLAKILAQNWGNLRIEAKVVDIGAKQLTSQAIAFDLENNLAIKVEVKRSISSSKGRYNDDMITVTGNAANSIAIRNAVLSVIPKAIVDKVYNAAKETITGDLSDENAFVKKREQIFKGFKDTHGVEEGEVLAAIGKSAVGQITKDDLVTLIGIAQAIKDGDTTVELAFRPNKGASNDDKTNAVTGAVHDMMDKKAKSKDEKTSATKPEKEGGFDFKDE